MLNKKLLRILGNNHMTVTDFRTEMSRIRYNKEDVKMLLKDLEKNNYIRVKGGYIFPNKRKVPKTVGYI